MGAARSASTPGNCGRCGWRRRRCMRPTTCWTTCSDWWPTPVPRRSLRSVFRPGVRWRCLNVRSTWAAMHNRGHVVPEDLQMVLPAVAAHRLVPSGDYSGDGDGPGGIAAAQCRCDQDLIRRSCGGASKRNDRLGRASRYASADSALPGGWTGGSRPPARVTLDQRRIFIFPSKVGPVFRALPAGHAGDGDQFPEQPELRAHLPARNAVYRRHPAYLRQPVGLTIRALRAQPAFPGKQIRILDAS